MVMMQKTVGDGRREEGRFLLPPAAASRSRRAAYCEAASPLLFHPLTVKVQVPFDKVLMVF